MRVFVAVAFLWVASAGWAQQGVDTDRDGLPDALEQRLLQQFVPEFQVGVADCSNVPALFEPGVAKPTVQAEDGTIYGQVFPAKSSTKEKPVVEIHYYHLWRTDCGPHGHWLDTEHVATLARADGSDLETARWRAQYWYAGAHEDTVCDVSQIARASTVRAEEHGAKVWISPGKHASYLNETLCKAGCGADRCEQMRALHVARVVNLGEVGEPMNGSVFVASREWPLVGKMSSTNFPAAPVARLEELPETDIAWFHPGHHPVQPVIANSLHTGQAIGHAGDNTTAALGMAGDNTDTAISVAGNDTGNALAKSFHKTTHALSTAAKKTGAALHVTEKDSKADAEK